MFHFIFVQEKNEEKIYPNRYRVLKNPMHLYYSNCEQNAPNLLVLNVQPNEGFSLCVNGKKSNQNNEMQK